MSYDTWKATEPDPCVASCDCHHEAPDDDVGPDDCSIERLLEDARLGDTVASVTLVEACERALYDDPDSDSAAAARQHIREYLSNRRPS